MDSSSRSSRAQLPSASATDQNTTAGLILTLVVNMLQIMRALAWLPACMLILGCSGQPAGAVEAQIRPSRDSAWGAYLGCFELRQITQSDPSLGAQVIEGFT